jgi:hypothetical protein
VPELLPAFRSSGSLTDTQLSRLKRIPDFADKNYLAERLLAFVAEWNEQAHPFHWSTKSVAKVMAKCEGPLAEAA